MITLTRIKSATKEFIKVLRFGKGDIQTADNVSPHGIDSKPVKNQLAIYAETRDAGQAIILGYLKNFDKTKAGETRIFATDEDGNEVFDIFIKNNGQCEFGGSGDNATRFKPLEDAATKLAADINAELVKIATGITGAGGAYTPSTISIDISESKVEEIELSKVEEIEL